MVSGPNTASSDEAAAAARELSSESTVETSDGRDDALALIPVRMLNEFTYCPRLGYLEWVQGEWAENFETLEGTFGHRNVDSPDRKSIPEPTDDEAPSPKNEGDEPIHARSLMLAAPDEGLIAKLDLLELDGRAATPVDYKRGKVPDVPGGAYDPERVQLCAQGLILRENAYECNEGILYFIGSRRRVVIPFDDELVALTRTQIRTFREIAAAGVCPPPLDDSPKCPRCSLVTICLPDETNFLRKITPEDSPSHFSDSAARTTPTQAKDGLRRLLPASHDALPLYVQEFGAYVGKSGERLVVSKQREELASVRLLDVSQLCLMGNVTLSAPALKELTIRGIPICHFTYGGWFHGITTGLSHNNVELRIRQYATAADPAKSLPLAKAFILGKIKNCRTMLRRHLGSPHAPVLRQLAECAARIPNVDSAESLLGLEGMAAKEYFAAFFSLLNGRHEFDVNGRNRRPPRDPVNAVLSFVYSLLTKEWTVTLQAVGFDPMRGFMHRPRFSRPSLALDLAEEFRPLIADSVTLTVFNNGEVDAGSFLHRAGAVSLTKPGRRSVLSAFERRLQTEITHPIFGYRISYRRILEVQARLLARTVMEELPQYPSFCTR
jgi:CRISPR-associated protein Cas1